MFVCCGQLVVATAQDIDIAPIYNSGYLPINKQVEFIRTINPISFDSARSTTAFARTNGQNTIFVGYDPGYYWFRFQIANRDTITHQLGLLLAQLGIREVEIFQNHEGSWRHLGTTGYKYPFESRLFNFTHYVYLISVASNSTDQFYVRIDETHAYKVIAFVLLHPKTLQKVVDKFYFLFGFMLGVMLLFLLFNVYLFISTKDKIHAWYSLYIFLQSFLLLKQHGLDAQFLGLDFELAYRATSMASIGTFAVGILLHVIQLLLTEINGNRWLNPITTTIKLIIVAAASIQMIVFLTQPEHQIEYVVFEIVNKCALFALIYILVVSVYVSFKGNRLALLIVIGLLAFLIGGLERLLFLSTDSYFLPPSILEVGIVLEAVLISFGLMMRYNEYRKESERLVIELAVEKLSQNQKIEMSLKLDRDRIKQELHDNLGGQLSSISVGLNRLPQNSSDSAIQTIQRITDQAISELRDSLWVIDRESISIAEVEQRINGLFWQYRKMEVPIVFLIRVEESILNEKLKASLAGNMFRIIQEATNNCVKHSQCTRFEIDIEKSEGQLKVTILDNGVGFDLEGRQGVEHYGLKNIKVRAEQMKAHFLIETFPEKGVRMVLVLPPNKS